MELKTWQQKTNIRILVYKKNAVAYNELFMKPFEQFWHSDCKIKLYIRVGKNFAQLKSMHIKSTLDH